MVAFGASIVLLLIAMVASALRGQKFVHEADSVAPQAGRPAANPAREGGALVSPAVPGIEVESADAPARDDASPTVARTAGS